MKNKWISLKNKITKWGVENNVRLWLLPITFIIVSIWLLIIRKTIGFNHLTIIISAIFGLIFIIECCWKIFKDNVLIFLHKNNRTKTFLLFLFMSIAVFAAYHIISVYGDAENTQDQILTVSGLLLTVMGIFVSAKILMAVNKSQTTEMSEYLSQTIDIIRKAQGNNIVYVISPTYCPGLTKIETSNMLDDLFTIIKSKQKKGVKFRYAFLQTNFQHKPDFEVMKTSMDVNKNYLEEISKDDFHWYMYKVFYEKEYGKIKKNNVADKIDFVEAKYNELERYYNSIKLIKDSINITNNNTTLTFPCELKEDYKKSDADTTNSFSGFFVTANISKGKYYLGSFHYDGVKTTFDGTVFKNSYIKNEMKDLFDGYILKYRM